MNTMTHVAVVRVVMVVVVNMRPVVAPLYWVMVVPVVV
jgi:hypothetical protein